MEGKKGGSDIDNADTVIMPTLETVEMFGAVKAKHHIILNHKFINESSNWIYGEESEMAIGGRKKADAVIKYLVMHQGEPQSHRFTTYDKRVYNAITSLYEAGNTILTPSMIYRQMTGASGKDYVSEKSSDAVIESVDNIRQTFAGVDFTDEAKNYRKQHDEYTIKGYLLEAEKVGVNTGHHEVIGYRLRSKPLLYEYFQMNSSHIISIEPELMNTKDTIKRESENTILLKEYLIRRVAIMKRNSKQSNCILLSRLYEEMELPTPTRRNVEQIRVTTDKILQSLAGKGFIKSHQFYKQGKAIKGVEVYF